MNSLLVTIGSFWPNVYGGPSQSVYFLTKSIHNLGHKTLVVSFLEKKDYKQNKNVWHKYKDVETLVDGIKIISLPRNPIGLLVYYKILISDRLSKNKTIYMNSIFFFPTFFSILYFVFFRSNKLIIAPRGELDPAALKKSSFLKKLVIYAFKILFMIKKNIIFHATSKREEDQIGSIFKKNNIKLVDNIFLSDLFKNVNEQNYIDENILEQKFFLILTRIDKKKSIEIALEAYKNLPFHIQSKYNLYIAGDGKDVEYKNQLIQFVKKNSLQKKIKFLGLLNFEEKVIYLKKATMLLFPSQGENFGNVVLEAWSCYCPVVISNKTPWKLDDKNSIGIVVENSSKGFIAGINHILKITKDNEFKEKKNEFNKKLKTFRGKAIMNNYLSMFFGV